MLQTETAARECGEFINERIIPSVNEANEGSIELFEIINIYITTVIEKNPDTRPGSNFSMQYRILEDEWNSDYFTERVKKPMKALYGLISNIFLNLNELYESCKKFNDNLKSAVEIEIKLLKAYTSKVESFMKSILEITDNDILGRVSWLELFGDRESPMFVLKISPLFVDKLLNESLYATFESVVLASATLTVDNKFDFISFINGLYLVEPKRLKYYTYQSPFNYQDRVLVCTPSDAPDPSNYRFNEYLNSFITDAVTATNGSTFVLFTSYSQLNSSYRAVSGELDEMGLKCYYQGQLEKSKLLQTFVDDISSNLFGTDSFWEGVDAPGETLSHVILAKLPFKMPTEPLEQARVEELTKKGRNGFNDYTLPQAVLKFRQGFGRLVRKKTDYGIVTILDPRVISKYYGKIFIKSLPRCGFQYGTKDEIVKKISDYIASHKILKQ